MRSPQICTSIDEAVRDIPDRASVMLPGFGPGSPLNLTSALHRQGARDLTIIANGAGMRGSGAFPTHGDLIADGRVRKLVASFTASPHPSRAGVAERLAQSGAMEVELVPQGTLAERIRAGGAGIPAFYTPTGAGTLLAEGKRHEQFDGRTYLMERALTADYAFIRAWKADTAGNLVFRLAARNYNPIMAMAARCTIVEVEQPILSVGSIPPDQIHTPGVYVHRMVQIPREGAFAVNRRQSATRAVSRQVPSTDASGANRSPLSRDQVAAVIARHLEPGWVVNLGIGIPTLASNYLAPDSHILLTSENGVMGYGLVAPEGLEDFDVVNAGVDYVLLEPGASVVHHGDSFALIRSGRVDCVVLGAYEVAADGSFANWKAQPGLRQLGGVGGAMDLAACARRVFIAMEHTTADGRPRLVQNCSLPITSQGGVTLVVTDLAVVAVREGQFHLLEHAPGYSVQEIQERTGAPLIPDPLLHPIPL